MFLKNIVNSVTLLPYQEKKKIKMEFPPLEIEDNRLVCC